MGHQLANVGLTNRHALLVEFSRSNPIVAAYTDTDNEIHP
jgi:hypothetical protein